MKRAITFKNTLLNLQNRNPELPLAFAYEMRNAVAHGYFKVDFEIVWKTIQNDLPELSQQTKSVLQQLIG